MADLVVPVRSNYGGDPSAGRVAIPVEGNPAGVANTGDLLKLRIGEEIFPIPGAGGGTTVVCESGSARTSP